jgi:hypothetical protein
MKFKKKAFNKNKKVTIAFVLIVNIKKMIILHKNKYIQKILSKMNIRA